MDTRQILMGRTPDVMGSLYNGLTTAQAQNEIGRQNALTALYQEAGPQIAAGQPQALNRLAQFSPEAALGVQQTRLGMDATRQGMAFDAEEMAMRRAAAKAQAEALIAQNQATLDAAQAEEHRRTMLGIVAGGAVAYDQGPQAFSAWAQSVGIPLDYNGFLPWAAQTAGEIEALDEYTKVAPKPKVAPEPKIGPLAEGTMIADPLNPKIETIPGYTPPPPKVDTPPNDATYDNFFKLPTVRQFPEVVQGYRRIKEGASLNSGVGDIAMVYGYMKLLDPTSVVREGEFATAEQVGGAAEKFLGLYNRLVSGERLTPEMRAQFIDGAESLYSAADAQLSDLEKQFRTKNPDIWLPDLRGGIKLDKNPPDASIPDLPPVPDGVSAEKWPMLWQNMTPERRKLFMVDQ